MVRVAAPPGLVGVVVIVSRKISISPLGQVLLVSYRPLAIFQVFLGGAFFACEACGNYMLITISILKRGTDGRLTCPRSAKSPRSAATSSRRRSSSYGLRGPDPRGPERLLHRQSGFELFGERGDDPPRAGRGAGEHEPPSDGLPPPRVV